jgi:hypothetical protein
MTPEEFLGFCIQNAPSIFVREKIGGKWGSYSLSEMPGDFALAHVRRWMMEGRLPLVVNAAPESPPPSGRGE